MKSIIIKKVDTLTLIFSTLAMCGFLLILRIKLNKSFFYLFLVWNVFLAIIPFAITMYLSSIKLSRIKLGFWFCVWLLFLPNAPYIITDLIHLRMSTSSLLWLDILVISSFSATGMLLFYLSLIDMKKLILMHFKKLPISKLATSIIFLCAFGVYLGRFLRYNSWEILTQPQKLFLDIFNLVANPYTNSEVWLFTFGFGLFLMVGFKVFNQLNKP